MRGLYKQESDIHCPRWLFGDLQVGDFLLHLLLHTRKKAKKYIYKNSAYGLSLLDSKC